MAGGSHACVQKVTELDLVSRTNEELQRKVRRLEELNKASGDAGALKGRVSALESALAEAKSKEADLERALGQATKRLQRTTLAARRHADQLQWENSYLTSTVRSLGKKPPKAPGPATATEAKGAPSLQVAVRVCV